MGPEGLHVVTSDLINKHLETYTYFVINLKETKGKK